MKTITYDETRWQLVPVQCTAEMEAVYLNVDDIYASAQALHDAVLAAAMERKK